MGMGIALRRTSAVRLDDPGARLAYGAVIALAGLVHLTLVPGHARGLVSLGTAFLAAGLGLIGVGAWVTLGGSARAWRAAAAVSGATALAYLSSRTAGFPDGHQGEWDAVGALTTLAELVVVAAALRGSGGARGSALGPAYLRPLPVGMVAWALAASSLGTALASPSDPTKPEGCIEPNRRITLHAVELPRTPSGEIRLAYGLTPETATIPGPTMEMFEGECLALTVVNNISAATLAELRDHPTLGSRDPDMPLGVSLHVHGVKYTTFSDGTLETGSWVPPGGARTYTWYAAPLAATAGRVTGQGTAGYWWYHDHIVGTPHGTGGAASGLFGALIVRRAGDMLPDRTYVVGMGPNATINLEKFPDCEGTPSLERASNSCFVARKGERVEFAVIGFGSDFHTFHLHGHVWADNRTGVLTGPTDQTRMVDVRNVGPAVTFGFQIVAGEEVGAGPWMFHCHVQAHSDTGMVSFLHVLGSDGTPVPVSADGHSH